ncbi:MAG: hypothetical protein JNM94_15835 [Phycisphaerae bacterium]|nr:hypothetical protein [Phycisphaerae bacterium]
MAKRTKKVDGSARPEGEVWIRSTDPSHETLGRIPFGKELQRAAMEWTSVLRNRRRWTAAGESVAAQSKRMRETLRELGLTKTATEAIVKAGCVEVCSAFESEREGWEARVFPWEHALSAATRELRDGRPMTIVRSLLAEPPSKPWGVPARVLYVESAPGGLRETYSFESERLLVTQAFRAVGDRDPHIDVRKLIDPTRESLVRAIKDYAPDVVHVAGLDSRQACGLLSADKVPESLRSLATGGNAKAFDPARVRDGYLVEGAADRVELIEAKELGAILCGAKTKPQLVSFNIYNSAARLAPLAIASGARYAIGYQDDFDDRLAELFYERLYWAFAVDREDLLSSFQYAMSEIREEGESLTGTGVVLWGLEPWTVRGSFADRRKAFSERSKEERAKRLKKPSAKGALTMSAAVVPFKELNYSILHNRNQRVFERFLIAKEAGSIDDVSIAVSLRLGAETATFEMSATESDAEWRRKDVSLANRICMPLASHLLRSLRDSVRTTITARVEWGGRAVYHQTHPITLLAIDEWRDDDTNRMWLPSFVQPGDRAVLRVIDAAQKYLAAISDDFSAGFDGYQQGDPAFVDAQARAIWSALVLDFNLSYVNPPPSFVSTSQRVRWPTTVLDGRRGTCIDLALLFAACLEFVNIHPLMVLLEGHAFPAYWRSEEAHERFVEVRGDYSSAEADGAPTPDALSGSVGEFYPWYERTSAYHWFVGACDKGEVVPIETVFLTQRSSFDEAVQEGRANLVRQREFHSILDVRLARDSNVTPLPLPEGGAA